MMSINVRLLGGFNATIGPAKRRLSLPPRAAKLFTYCLFHRDCWHSREALIELFWPDAPLEQARSSLNSTLSRLRQAFPSNVGPIIVSQGREAFSLADELPLSVDVDTFLREVAIDERTVDEPSLTSQAAAQLQDALSLYRGELLPGWYDEWLLIERERLRHRYVVGLSRLMTHFTSLGSLEPAIALGRCILALDPLREAVHRSMMELFMRSGHRAAALKQFAGCSQLLEAELGVSPMHETKSLYAKILESEDLDHHRITIRERKKSKQSHDRSLSPM